MNGKKDKHIGNILLRFLLLWICSAMIAATAFAAEDINLGGDGKNSLVYGTTLADGRILMVGSRTAPGQYAGSARMVCLNRDGTESWQYIDDTHDGGRFCCAAELEDGTIGLVFQHTPDGENAEYKLRFFTADGKPTGKEVIIPARADGIHIQNATKSRLQLICETVIREETNDRYKTVHEDDYLIDWEGNEIAFLNTFLLPLIDGVMIEEADGLVMNGYDIHDDKIRRAVRKTDMQGNLIWETLLECAWPDKTRADVENFIRTDDGGYIVIQLDSLYTAEEEKWEYRYALVKLDSEGNILRTTTEGFEGTEGRCMTAAMDDGKIAVVFSNTDKAEESMRLENPRTIAWFDENGKPLGTVEMEISLENFKQLRQSIGTTNGDGRIVLFFGDRMIPMEDGLWMSGQINAYETENIQWRNEECYTGLFKVPEP